MEKPTVTLSADQLLRMDNSQASELLSSLPLDIQRELVLVLKPGRKRQDLILLSKQAEMLTRLLPPEEFVVTVKEIGEQDALPLIEMSSNAQLTHLLDLDVWVGSDVDMLRMGQWLELLWECGADRVVRWLKSTDFELLVLLIERNCLLVEKDVTDQLPEALQSRVVSPDNYHYLVVKLGTDLKMVQHILDLMYTKTQELFFALLANMGTTPLAELEELSLRWRQGRLEDRGFPDYGQAQDFYQPRSKNQIAKDSGLPTQIDNPPRFALRHCAERKLLALGLDHLDPNLRETIASQIANLINRVIVAEGRIASDLEAIASATQRVSGRLEMGMADLGAYDGPSASKLLATIPMLHIVQLAQHLFAERQSQADKLLAVSTRPLFELLEAPTPARLKALLQKRPRFVEHDATLARDFQSLADLEQIDRDIQRSEAALSLARALRIDLASLPDPFPEGLIPSSREGLSLQLLLQTAFACEKLELDRLVPIQVDRLADLFSKLQQGSLQASMSAWCQQTLPTRLAGTDLLVAELSANLGQLLTHDPTNLDPRFVAGLWFDTRATVRA